MPQQQPANASTASASGVRNGMTNLLFGDSSSSAKKSQHSHSQVKRREEESELILPEDLLAGEETEPVQDKSQAKGAKPIFKVEHVRKRDTKAFLKSNCAE